MLSQSQVTTSSLSSKVDMSLWLINIISNADNGTAYNEYFDDSELDESGEPTEEQIDELKEYLNDNYNYLP